MHVQTEYGCGLIVLQSSEKQTHPLIYTTSHNIQQNSMTTGHSDATVMQSYRNKEVLFTMLYRMHIIQELYCTLFLCILSFSLIPRPSRLTYIVASATEKFTLPMEELAAIRSLVAGSDRVYNAELITTVSHP